MTSAQPDDFASRIAGIGDELAAMFVAHNLGAALAQLPPALSAPSDRAKIVVVGEVGSGKTELINALLDRPGLLPTGPTKTYYAVGAGQPEAVRIHLAGGGVVVDEPQNLRDLLHRCSQDAAIDNVEVVLDEPGLEAMTVFDTPGVGGLDDAAAQITLAALEQATALVFVCSVESIISIAEREFIAEAARRIDHIVFVGSKVDLTRDRGAANLRENQEALNRPGLLPIGRFPDLTFLPVSAHTAATATGNPRKLARSGVPALREQLNHIATGHTVYSQLNTMRAMKEALTLAHQELNRRRKAVEDPNVGDELARLTEQLKRLDGSNTAWRRTLMRKLQDANYAVRKEHKRRIAELRTEYQRRLLSLPKDQIRRVETDLVNDLCQLQAKADAHLRSEVAAIARLLWQDILTGEDGIFDGDSAIAELADRLPAPDESPADYIAQRAGRFTDVSETLTGLQGGYLGTMMFQNLAHAVGTAGLAGVVGVSAISAPVTLGLALPFGVGWYLLNKRVRDRNAELAGLRSWVSGAIHDTEVEIITEIDRGFTQATRLLEDGVEAAVADARKDAQSAMSELKKTAGDSQAEIKRIERLSKELPTKQWNLLHDEVWAFAMQQRDTDRENLALEGAASGETS